MSQNPNGDAKAIEVLTPDEVEHEGRVAMRWSEIIATGEPRPFRAFRDGYHVARQAMASELEAARLELEQANAAWHGLGLEGKGLIERLNHDVAEATEQLTTERARAEEAERLADELAKDLAKANARVCADPALSASGIAELAAARKQSYSLCQSQLSTANAHGARLEGTLGEALTSLAAANARVARLEEAVRSALDELEMTRWNPNGDMWSTTPEGLNHGRVCEAMDAIRAALSAAPRAPTEGPTCVEPGCGSEVLAHIWCGEHIPANRRLSAPQASTEQVDHSKVGRNSWTLGTCAGCGGTNAALFDGPYCCKPCRRQREEASPIPQVTQASERPGWKGPAMGPGNQRVAQRSTLPWDQPRTTSAELAGGDPFAKPERASPHAGSPLSSAYSAHKWAEVVADARAKALREELVAVLRSFRMGDTDETFDALADRLEGK